MSLSRRTAPIIWMAALVSSLAVGLWVHERRATQVESVTAAVPTTATLDPASPTGYAGGVRQLVVPGGNADAFQWVVQTQQMLATGNWRVREAAYDNAPQGRPVHLPSPYRWWLATLAWVDRVLTGNPAGLAVERAALWADPVLHLLAVGVFGAFTAWRFGALAAAMLAGGLVFVFPFAGLFVSGAPEDTGLTQVVILASLLSLLAGVLPPAPTPRARAVWFGGSGALAGGALWLNPSAAVPVIGGLALGGLVLAWRRRGTDAGEPLPWRMWGACGATVTMLGYLLEFAPAHLSWSTPGPVEIHPAYAITWLGLGDLLERAARRIEGAPWAGSRAGRVAAVAALVALFVLPATLLLLGTPGFLAPENSASRLTALNGGIRGENLFAWLKADGPSLAFWAAVAPCLLVVGAFQRLPRVRPDHGGNAGAALLLGPAIIALGVAAARLSWWSHLDTVLLAILVAMAGSVRGTPIAPGRWIAWLVLAIALFLPGAWLLVVRPAGQARDERIAVQDQQSLVERDLAHWLARRSGPDGANVLAPPNMTASLIYYGGLSGLGSPYRENEAGFAAAVRVAAATSADEAEALARQRMLSHIVMPTWDAFLDEYARLGTHQPESSLIGLLHAWLPPRWLVPVAYQVPAVSTYAGERVLIFEITDLQDLSLAWSRMAGYFVDMGDLELASELCRAIEERFPDDLGGLISIARTQLARNQRFLLARTLDIIEARIDEGADEALPWDLRVSLSLVLAAADRTERARDQTALCVDYAGEAELRRLGSASFRPFAALCHEFGLTFAEPELQRVFDVRVQEIAAGVR